MLNIIYEALSFFPELSEAIEKGNLAESMIWYASNSTTDICCLLIPAAIVLPLELRPAKKFAVIVLFALSSM